MKNANDYRVCYTIKQNVVDDYRNRATSPELAVMRQRSYWGKIDPRKTNLWKKSLRKKVFQNKNFFEKNLGKILKEQKNKIKK